MIVVESEHGRIEYSQTIAGQCDLWQLLHCELQRYQTINRFPRCKLQLVSQLFFNNSQWPALPHYYYNYYHDHGKEAISVDIYIDCSDYYAIDKSSARHQQLLDYYCQLLHHEIYHVIENTVLSSTVKLELSNKWMSFEAVENYQFASGEEYLTAYYRNNHVTKCSGAKTKGYASDYAKSSPDEDRAETFALCIARKSVDPWNDPLLQAKTSLLSTVLTREIRDFGIIP